MYIDILCICIQSVDVECPYNVDATCYLCENLQLSSLCTLYAVFPLFNTTSKPNLLLLCAKTSGIFEPIGPII